MLRALDQAVRHSVPKPTALIVNFPSNPTAYVADARLLPRGGRVLPQARDLDPVGPGLRRDLFRRRAAALDAAGAGRAGHHGGVHLDVQDLFHAGLAHGLRRRQRAADLGAGADEVVPGLRRLHPDPGGRHRRAERPAGLRGGDAGAVQGTPRRGGARPERGRLGGAEPGGVDVRLGADPAAPTPIWAAWSSASCCWRAPRWRWRRASASASRATATCASPWWRTRSGCARRCAASRASCRADEAAPWRRRA